jgi:outer membrane protein insertion porin family
VAFSPVSGCLAVRSPSARRAVVAALAAVLALLLPTWAFAQARDGGAPAQPQRPASGADAGAPPAALGGDAGTAAAPDAAAAAPEEGPIGPPIRLPPTDSERAEGSIITAIEVEGARRVSREDVLLYLREKVGQPYKADTLAGDVRALWDAGFFEDIQVDLARTDRGVRLRFKVVERANIKSIEYEGNDELDAEKLGEIIELKPNTILSVPAVRRSVQKIKDAYGEKGYFLADVEYALEPQRDNEVIVKFKIREHQQVSVRRITFVGNDHVSDADLRAQMMTGQGSFFSFGSGGPFKQDVFERDVVMISALYYDRGYMTVQVGTPRVMLTPDREGIDISLSINEGPRFKIRQLKIYERDVDGKEVEPLGGRKALRQMIAAQPGDWFNRAEIVRDLQAVRTLYRDAGYFNVEAEPETEVDVARHEVDIVIPIRRGPPVRIERIEIKGNTKTRDKVIRRELEVQEGQLYSETGVEVSKRRVTALGYFERVDVSTEQGSAPDKVIVNVEVAERPTGTFQVGAGFSSVENFIATAQVQQANLFGNGQSLALQASISSLRQIISIRFFEPYFFDSLWSFSTDLYDQLFVYPDFSRRSRGGAVTFGYAIVQPWLRVSLTTTAQYDSVDTAQTGTFFGSPPTGFGTFQRLPLANLYQNGATLSFRPAIVYDTRDNRLFPTSGLYLQYSVEWAGPFSEIQFLRHQWTGRVYYNLGGATGQPGSGWVLKLNTDIGYISSPKADGVPIFQRYYLGGILNLRGYRLRTIGARLPLNASLDPNSSPIPNGANIGGNLQAYANLELEFPILDKVGIRGVVFFDAGNAWNTESQYCQTAPAPQFSKLVSPCFTGIDSLVQLRLATGAGIRWFSPLGPLRFEWGFPLNRLPYEESNVFEFTIGNFF